LPSKMAQKTGNDGEVDMGALWTAPESDKLQGGSFSLKLPRKPPVRATAAPGIISTGYLVPSTGKMQ
jgi:hypothetical protein